MDFLVCILKYSVSKHEQGWRMPSLYFLFAFYIDRLGTWDRMIMTVDIGHTQTANINVDAAYL